MPKHHDSIGSSYRRESKYHWFWVWSCCNCARSAGMTVEVEQCPEYNCGHTRCEYCPVESHKRRNEGGGGGYASTFGANSVVTNPQDSDADRGHKPFSFLPLPKTTNDILTIERATITEVNTERNPTGRNASITKSRSPEPFQIGNLKIQDDSYTASTSTSPSNWTDSSEFVTEAFNDMKTTLESDTEVETMASDTTEEASDLEDAWAENDTTTVESRLLCVLSHDLDLAARIIPRVHTLAHGSINSTLTNAAPQDQDGTDRNQNYANSSSTATPSNQPTPQRSRSQKRSLHQNGRDERDESSERGGSHRPKRRKPSPSRMNMPTFACHFYKLDPDRYSGCLKYRTCACPSVPHDRLSRIKDHFKTHKSRQCNRCYHDFEDIDQLMAHQRDPKPCNTRSPSLREGIDESQAERIDCILKTKRGTNPSDRPKLEIEKWYQIWRILFRDVPKPSNPWSQPKTSSRTEPHDTEAIVAGFERILNQDILNGTLRPNFETQYFTNALRRAFDEESNQLLEIQASESPESNLGDAENRTRPFSNIARGPTNMDDALGRECPVPQSTNDATNNWTHEYESHYGDFQHTPKRPPSPMTVWPPDLQARPADIPLTISTYQPPTQGRTDSSTTQNSSFLPESLSNQIPDQTIGLPTDSLFEQNDSSMTDPFDGLDFGPNETHSFNLTIQEPMGQDIDTFGIKNVEREWNDDLHSDSVVALLESENEYPAARDPDYKTKYVGRHGLPQL